MLSVSGGALLIFFACVATPKIAVCRLKSAPFHFPWSVPIFAIKSVRSQNDTSTVPEEEQLVQKRRRRRVSKSTKYLSDGERLVAESGRKMLRHVRSSENEPLRFCTGFRIDGQCWSTARGCLFCVSGNIDEMTLYDQVLSLVNGMIIVYVLKMYACSAGHVDKTGCNRPWPRLWS